MSNELMLLSEILIVFSLLLVFAKFFKYEGLVAWIALGTVLANVLTAKQACAFGMSYTVGTVWFGSTFLATDIINELYDKEKAKLGVTLGMVSSILLIVATQICLRYVPAPFDTANEAMHTLFSLNLRISISSVIMYYVANIADVYLYDFLKKKTNGKYMWLRNNVCTILCNTVENFFFMTGAFIGIFSMNQIIGMAIATSVIEVIVGLLDTPFLYIAKKYCK